MKIQKRRTDVSSEDPQIAISVALPEMFNQHFFSVKKPWTLVRTKEIASTIWIAFQSIT